MDWPSYLRKVVSTAAGAAAGVAAGAGGPVAIASAKVAAEKVSDDLLKQFLGAHADQMQRIEEISLEMRDRLIRVENMVGGLLDAPWNTALTHIEEAGRRPLRREQELELARERLFQAWGVAAGLLDRDTGSLDPAALRCPLIAQQIAAVYSLLGEPANTVHWLKVAYIASRGQLHNQVNKAYDIFVQKVKRAKSAWSSHSSLTIEVWSRDRTSRDPLWIYAPKGIIGSPGQGKSWAKSGFVARDLDFEGRVAALVVLDAEAELLRRTCLDAGVEGAFLRLGLDPWRANVESVRAGERRALADGLRGGLATRALVVFNATTAVVLKVVTEPWVGTFDHGPPPNQIRLDRYQDILPIAFEGLFS